MDAACPPAARAKGLIFAAEHSGPRSLFGRPQVRAHAIITPRAGHAWWPPGPAPALAPGLMTRTGQWQAGPARTRQRSSARASPSPVGEWGPFPVEPDRSLSGRPAQSASAAVSSARPSGDKFRVRGRTARQCGLGYASESSPGGAGLASPGHESWRECWGRAGGPPRVTCTRRDDGMGTVLGPTEKGTGPGVISRRDEALGPSLGPLSVVRDSVSLFSCLLAAASKDGF